MVNDLIVLKLIFELISSYISISYTIKSNQSVSRPPFWKITDRLDYANRTRIFFFQSSFSHRWLARGSSTYGWCEEKYSMVRFIAEFTNTISALPLLTIPLIFWSTGVWESYRRHVSYAPYITYGTMFIVGLASIYVHSTLSLLGQFCDEISIVWALFLGYALLWPKQYLPKFMDETITFATAVFISIGLTLAWFIHPYISGFINMFCAQGAMLYLLRGIVNTEKEEVMHINKTGFFILLLAILFWVGDFTICGYCKYINLPGIHNMWHITVAYGASFTVASSAYSKAVSEAPVFIEPRIKYLFMDKWGLPYVECISKDIDFFNPSIWCIQNNVYISDGPKYRYRYR